MLHESDIIDQFCRAMREEDIHVSAADLKADGKLHRIRADGDREKTVWYVLHADDRPAGMFGCNRRYGHDTKFTWKADIKRAPLTAAEKRAYRERMERIEAQRAAEDAAASAAAAERANRLWSEAVDCDAHPYLERKGIRAHGLRVGRWEVINQDTGEVHTVTNQALLIPMRDLTKRIHSLQAIMPKKREGASDKWYLTDGDKEGHFWVIGRPLEHEGKQVIVICEGYATGASIHEATGHAVIIAFDAPNLLPVAKVWRARFPDAIIIIAADNDQWTLKPVVNPGLTRARECEKEVGALVAFPPFDAALGATNERGGRAHGPTDFNDLQQLEGHEAICGVFDAVLNPPPAPDPAPPDNDPPPPWEGSDEDDPPASDGAPPDGDDDEDDGDDRPENNGYFTILGYDRDQYFIFSHGKRQIIVCTKGDFSDIGLIALAPLNWWEACFPGSEKAGGIDRKAAANFIVRTAEKRGIYDTSRIRGRGAWADEGRAIYHHGGYLSVDGQRVEITRLESEFVYELGKSLPDPHDRQFTEAEGQQLLELVRRFRWSKPGSAVLFVGWVALAPVCGAMPWRPHLWITGGAGSGKSTIAKMAHNLLRGTDVFAQGSSSEAGIRQRLKADALPVLMDESESTEESDAKRIQSILALIRQASTESDAETLKGTADGSGMTFHIRSMFCLASIQVALKNKADIDRLSVLTLRSGRDGKGDPNEWKSLRDAIHALVEHDPTVPRRLLRRAIDLLPTTLKNIDVFTEAGARVFGSQRDGDQYGTLLAGAWSLISSAVATQEQAEALIKEYDWSEHLEGADEDESARALSALMEGKIRINGIDITVYELVCEASNVSVPGLDIGSTKADSFLQRHGMRVKDGFLVLSNSSNELKRLVADTQYAADLRGMLLRVPGADRNINKPLKFNGVQSKCIRVPLDPILHDLPTTPPARPATLADLETEPF
ncbi:putative DNA primase/helicase [Bordetella phage vB_BbrM_PHB04]|uniref:Putative DNA primase/helicase n=1 Tax=Bordetella phage vB_BbrM_PHB04 TaxID=2029657 RepID=A0A291LAR9_9CAUD|nr:DNA primase [Bordetella phage vB_BbrM_PHB04]ATI15716.1 putative DNA primase/helicase [Bordetella phage vB_BbrM_PHB04]